MKEIENMLEIKFLTMKNKLNLFRALGLLIVSSSLSDPEKVAEELYRNLKREMELLRFS